MGIISLPLCTLDCLCAWRLHLICEALPRTRSGAEPVASSVYPELYKLPSFVMLRDDGAHGLGAVKLSLGTRTII